MGKIHLSVSNRGLGKVIAACKRGIGKNYGVLAMTPAFFYVVPAEDKCTHCQKIFESRYANEPETVYSARFAEFRARQQAKWEKENGPH